MKKIYILTAVFALLTLSLNAQMLPEFQRLKADNTKVTELRNGHHLSASAASSNQGTSMRAPKKVLNEGEYYVGPYTTDDFSTNGLGFGNQYNQDQSILLGTILNRSEFEEHIGDKIVGFRFALAGTGVLPVFEFAMIPYYDDGTSLNFDQENLKEWGMEEWNQPTTTTSTVTFTASSDHGSTTGNNSPDQVVKDPVTMYGSNAAFNASTWGTYTYRYYANSTTTFSTTTGKITRIEFTGTSGYAVSNWTASSGTLTTSGNNGTWTGNETSVSFTAGAQVRCTNVVVTVTSTSTPTYQILDCGQWHEYRLAEPVEFNVASDVTKLFIGYSYYQQVSGGTNFELYPIAYNPNSTGHNHMAYMYADASSTSTPNYQLSWWLWDFSNYGDLAVQLIFESTGPKLIAPEDGSTVNVGTHDGAGVSTTIPVSGNNLTGDLTVSVSGAGFSVSPTTITAADANAGTSVTVTYNGTDPNATGTLTITSSNGEVETVTVNLTASYAEPVPKLTAPTDGSTVNVGTNTGTGVSKTITVSGEHLTGDLTISVDGDYFTVEPTTISAADANAGTATITVTYNGYSANATGTLTITSSNDEVDPVTVNLTGSFNAQPAEPVTGLLRMHLLLVDQLKANIPDDNSHADSYRYVLKYEPAGGETKQSNNVDVEIQKTECEVKGYYTKAEIDGDTDGTLTMNVLTADVQFNLTDDDNTIEFYDLQGAAGRYPTLGQDYLTKLQQTTGFVYYEMLPGSPNEGDDYPAGLHHYYDDSTPILTGTYTTAESFMSYAPSLSTWGIDRRYYEEDHLDNTYGAPIWRTRVGDVQIQGKPVMQKQVINANTPQEAPNPWTSWSEGGKDYSLFFLGVNAQGTLPNTEGTYGTNIKYEPYMFRVFVASPTGKLRKYVKTLGEGGGYSLSDGGPIAANEKYCVGSFLVDDGWHADDLFFSKTVNAANSLSFRDGGNNMDPDAWDGFMKFAAEDGITKNDIKVYVRFYYMVEGWDTGAKAEGEDRPGNGAEGSGDPEDPSTYVYEFISNAEVVGVTYYNAQGMMSSKPFSGLNIVVTRYSDGTTSTTKVMR